jgi:tellurite resistance protein
MKPLSQMSRDERLLLLRFACDFAWADQQIRDQEKQFVRRLMRRFRLDETDTAQVEEWLGSPPEADSVDPSTIPVDLRETFLEAARAVIFADGEVEDEERQRLKRLKAALVNE